MVAILGGVRARACVWPGTLLFATEVLRTPPHATCAAALLVALDGPLRLTGARGCEPSASVAVLAPNVPHATDSARTLVVLVDPDDDAYRHVFPLVATAPIHQPAAATRAALRTSAQAAFGDGLDCREAARLVARLLAILCPAPLARLPWDGRVLRACRAMRAALPWAMPRSAQLAGTVGLSESRFLHLFREQLGMPLRRYQLWLRIRCAMRLWRDERAVAGVALGSGFYDQAHFTRTLRRMTGYAPSLLRPPGVRVNVGAMPSAAPTSLD